MQNVRFRCANALFVADAKKSNHSKPILYFFYIEEHVRLLFSP